MCLNLQIPIEDMESSLSAEGICLLPCSPSPLPAGILSPMAPEQHKHYPNHLSTGKNSLPALIPGGWLLWDGDAAAGHVTFCIAQSNPETVDQDVPTAGCLPRGRTTRSPLPRAWSVSALTDMETASPAFPPLAPMSGEDLGCRNQLGAHPASQWEASG